MGLGKTLEVLALVSADADAARAAVEAKTAAAKEEPPEVRRPGGADKEAEDRLDAAGVEKRGSPGRGRGRGRRGGEETARGGGPRRADTVEGDAHHRPAALASTVGG